MKIVDRKTFLALPSSTLFAKYEPCVFGDLEIKHDSFKNDFVTSGPLASRVMSDGSNDFFDKLQWAQVSGESLPMDFGDTIRDGSFEENQMFAVYEDRDVIELIAQLSETRRVAHLATTGPKST